MDGVSILPDLGIINISCSHASSIVHWKVWSVLSLKCFQNLTDSSCFLAPLSKPTSPLHWIATKTSWLFSLASFSPFPTHSQGQATSHHPSQIPLVTSHVTQSHSTYHGSEAHNISFLTCYPSPFLSRCFLSDSSCFGHSNRVVHGTCPQHSTSVLTLEPHSGFTPLSRTVASPGNSVCVYMVHHSLSFFPC